MLAPLDDGGGGRCSAGTHRDQRRAFSGAPGSRSAVVITRLPGTPDPDADVIAAVNENHTAALWPGAISCRAVDLAETPLSPGDRDGGG
jgi:hypothetical protein